MNIIKPIDSVKELELKNDKNECQTNKNDNHYQISLHLINDIRQKWQSNEWEIRLKGLKCFEE